MSLLNRLERLLGRFAISNLSLYLIGGQVMFLGFALIAQFDLRHITLLPTAVLHGQLWRLFTFVLIPPVTQLSMAGAVFLAFAWYFFYMIGEALEHYWGTFRYNLFFLLGWALTVAASFVTPNDVTTYLFFAVSVFLAFAYLNPDFELYIFFILPVRIKWFALVMWIGFGYTFLVGDIGTKFMVLAAVGNFLVFFARDIFLRIRGGRRRMVHQARMFGAQNDAPEPRHRCHVCGKTDLSHPQMDFRYCSKCANDECYCSEHINNHEHTTAKS